LLAPVIWWGAKWIRTDPDGKNVYMYIRERSIFWGNWVLPWKFVREEKGMTKDELMYDWYQQKGLPVPEKYLTEEERAILKKRRRYYDYLKKGKPVPEEYVITEEDEIGLESRLKKSMTQPQRIFDPQITMTTTRIPGLTEHEHRRCISTV
jgi:hypothetical protein